MKSFLLFGFLILFIDSKAQSYLDDNHELSQLYIIDPQTNQKIMATDDNSILFKDALLELIFNTERFKQITNYLEGREQKAIITQLDPNVYIGFKIVYQSLSDNSTLCSYMYNSDQNELFWYNPTAKKWEQETITEENMFNLNKCYEYSKLDSSNQQEENIITETEPPTLPDYEQPPCENDGYIWQPGYWAYNNRNLDYCWIPGIWIAPPRPEVLWTPPYWGYEGGGYHFHQGYWAHEVGYYGGINYGFGYTGHGFYGGEWREGRFNYNTVYVRINPAMVHHNYEIRRVEILHEHNRPSFNGPRGVLIKPTHEELVEMNRVHIRPTREQVLHTKVSFSDRNQFAKINHGEPRFLSMNKINGHYFNPHGETTTNTTRFRPTPAAHELLNHVDNTPNNRPIQSANHLSSNENKPAAQSGQYRPSQVDNHISSTDNKPATQSGQYRPSQVDNHVSSSTENKPAIQSGQYRPSQATNHTTTVGNNPNVQTSQYNPASASSQTQTTKPSQQAVNLQSQWSKPPQQVSQLTQQNRIPQQQSISNSSQSHSSNYTAPSTNTPHYTAPSTTTTTPNYTAPSTSATTHYSTPSQSSQSVPTRTVTPVVKSTPPKQVTTTNPVKKPN